MGRKEDAGRTGRRILLNSTTMPDQELSSWASEYVVNRAFWSLVHVPPCASLGQEAFRGRDQDWSWFGSDVGDGRAGGGVIQPGKGPPQADNHGRYLWHSSLPASTVTTHVINQTRRDWGNEIQALALQGSVLPISERRGDDNFHLSAPIGVGYSYEAAPGQHFPLFLPSSRPREQLHHSLISPLPPCSQPLTSPPPLTLSYLCNQVLRRLLIHLVQTAFQFHLWGPRPLRSPVDEPSH